jgi:ribosomal protein L13E
VPKKCVQVDAKVQKEPRKPMHHVKAQISKPDGRLRAGKGFSRPELKKAGFSVIDARKADLPVDLRRGTIHEENIETVKTHITLEKHKPKPKPLQTENKEKAKS